jgi:hypothetical protein
MYSPSSNAETLKKKGRKDQVNTTKTVINMESNEQALKYRLWHRAGCCGLSTTAIVESLWASYLLDGLYHCQRLLHLADTYSKARLEAASRRALYYGKANYRTIRRILQRNAEKLPLTIDTDIWGRKWDF